MKISLTQIGNSKGIIIPAKILQQWGDNLELSLEIKEDKLIISKSLKPRQGWEQAFLQSAHEDAPALINIPNQFDDDEWTW